MLFVAVVSGLMGAPARRRIDQARRVFGDGSVKRSPHPAAISQERCGKIPPADPSPPVIK